MIRMYFIAGCVVALVALLTGGYLAIYHSGKQSCMTASLNTEIKNVGVSNEIKNAVAGHTASANRAGLQPWSRP